MTLRTQHKKKGGGSKENERVFNVYLIAKVTSRQAVAKAEPLFRPPWTAARTPATRPAYLIDRSGRTSNRKQRILHLSTLYSKMPTFSIVIGFV